MANNARNHIIPAGTDTTVSRATIFETFGNSIRDVVPVSSVTERSQRVTALNNVGQGPTAARPLVVYRADAPGLHRLESTVNGTVWTPASGVLSFATEAAANSFASANGGLLTAGDMANVGGIPYQWTGAAWARFPAGGEEQLDTDVNGFVTITHGLGANPRIVQLTMGRANGMGDGVGRLFTPILWDYPTAATFRVRFRREDTNQYTDQQNVRFHWVAFR